ncbi:MAG: glycosyl transferase family 2 [Nitrospirae bacterium GWC2_57_9]|nr:MAG: glycosyl transferase family 2 [Nitrospirae bacterium GWC2_57_9]
MRASIIIRTYNEGKYLPQVLRAIAGQRAPGLAIETVIVDSGSTDDTLEIAERFNAVIVHIKKNEFTFGRSLNLGCEAAKGDYLVFLSGHCIPAGDEWIVNLTLPLIEGKAAYVYGRQIGNGESRFSECQLFRKYFPETSKIPQEGFFCNNANAAILRTVWEQEPFYTDLTGLEDMDLARRLVAKGLKIGYAADASVYHLHLESWHKVRMRYQREAIALRHIMPEIHINFRDFLRYFTSAVFLDFSAAIQDMRFGRYFSEIILFRFMQYWGAYRGNHEHRKLSARRKEEYFYPK